MLQYTVLCCQTLFVWLSLSLSPLPSLWLVLSWDKVVLVGGLL